MSERVTKDRLFKLSRRMSHSIIDNTNIKSLEVEIPKNVYNITSGPFRA